MKHRYILFVLLACLQFGCSKKAVVRFTQKPPELTSSDILTEIMLVNKSPRIVLRVPNTRKGVTNTQGTGNQSSQGINLGIGKKNGNRKGAPETQDAELKYDETALYNTIEKQLFKEGFSVRDRGLFNQVLDDNTGVDYSKINALTNTDLILELVRIDNPGYTTNVCFLDSDNQQRFISEYRGMSGASVEFKLVYVKTNEIVGSYKIHYTPCTEGCRGLYKKGGLQGVFTSTHWLKPGEHAIHQLNRKAQQDLDQDALEVFIADATHQLVQTMR